MIKKNVLVLLFALSAAVSVFSAETDVVLPEIDVVATEVQETPATSTDTVEPKASISDKMAAYLPTIDGGTKRTLQRSAALFITHNLLKKSYAPTLNWKNWRKGFNLLSAPASTDQFNSKLNKTLRATSDYAYIIAKYLIDTKLEKTNNSTSAEIIEWVAGELTIVQEFSDDEIKAATVSTALNNFKVSKAMQLVLKAASRKQLWLPEELEITQFLKTPMARCVLTASEKGKFDVSGCKFATIGMVAEKVAGDLLVILAATNKLPKFVVNLMDTDRGYDLVKDLFAKAIEDVITLTNDNVDFTITKSTLPFLKFVTTS